LFNDKDYPGKKLTRQRAYDILQSNGFVRRKPITHKELNDAHSHGCANLELKRDAALKILYALKTPGVLLMSQDEVTFNNR
jgi:hypothetical protein